MTDAVKKNVVKRRPDFFAVDFFCGAGGTTRGLIDAGGYVIAGVDKDTRCRETYVENNSNTTIDYASPTFLRRDVFPATDAYPEGEHAELEVDLERLIEHYRGRVPGTPLLFAICAPCQPFTKLSRKELSEARKAGRERDSNLLTEAAKFVERFRPEMVLSENVQGIGDPKYGGVWDGFREQLGRLGYATGSKVVCTSNFGVPQYRRRSILVAVRRELANPAFLTASDPGDLVVPEADPDNVVKTVQAAIGHLPALAAGATDPEIPNHKTRSLSDLNLKRLSAAMPGISNIYMEDTPRRRPVAGLPSQGEREAPDAMLHRRLHTDESRSSLADDHDQVPQHLQRAVRSLRCRAVAGDLATRGRRAPVVSRRLRLLSHRHDRTDCPDDRQCSAAQTSGVLLPPSGRLHRATRSAGRCAVRWRVGRSTWLRQARSTPKLRHRR